VLTAGIATRLRPLSNVRAKAALPVGGKPIVGRILGWLHAAGVRQAVLNLHHLPCTVTRVVGDGSQWGPRVRYSWEPQLLGSAGGPKRAIPLLDAPRFLIVNGDTLTDCDLAALVGQHVSTGARVTMAVIRRREERAIVADRDGVVIAFGPGDEHFIGVQAVNRDVFDSVPDDRPSEVVKSVYPAMVQTEPGAVRVFRSRAEFLDVGTVADYFRTVEVVTERESKPFDRGNHVVVDPSAVVDHSILWDNVRVGARAVVRDCIVTDDVFVAAGSRHERCALVSAGNATAVSPIKMGA
jgi:NDP-sugar pyrophosphorylase family protein